jgi:hypothetical protein
MSLLIYSGLLYLFGISIVLAFKPELMFSKDGNWKEFGIGRNREKYTWMPFWLFAIMWAILSYIMVLVFIGTPMEEINGTNIPFSNNSNNSNNSRKSSKKTNRMEIETNMDKKGYYILNGKNYIYLGPEAPNMVFNNTDVTNNSFDNDE